MYKSHFYDVNVFQSDPGGLHIRIAVVDSILRAPPDSNYDTDGPVNYVASDERDTTGHGTKITSILDSFSPRSEYKPHRVVAPDGEFRPSNFLKAMDDVRNDNVDVVNISAGKYHDDCEGQCRLCTAVDNVTREGSVVIAGAGNRKEERSLDVFCPARSSNSIAVGMSETLCDATPPRDRGSLRTVGQIRPPGAYWGTGDREEPYYPDGAYCSHRGCSPFHECRDNRRITYWNGNVERNDYLPEVVAPGHLPMVDHAGGEYVLEPGTSYSTAIVTGCVATVMSELFPDLPTLHQIKRAIESTSQDLDCGIVGKIDMMGLFEALS